MVVSVWVTVATPLSPVRIAPMLTGTIDMSAKVLGGGGSGVVDGDGTMVGIGAMGSGTGAACENVGCGTGAG